MRAKVIFNLENHPFLVGFEGEPTGNHLLQTAFYM